MIPLNRVIAVKIGTATTKLMSYKDARVKLITECFRSIKSIKMSGLEDTMAARSMIHRDNELKYLSQRKYLDSWCVFLWASLPLLVPYITFVTTVTALNRQLSASEVFTTLALLNMLIFPMNAYPWIINGAVEAFVSIRRLSLILVEPKYDSDEDSHNCKLNLGINNSNISSNKLQQQQQTTNEIISSSTPLSQTKSSTIASLFNQTPDDLFSLDSIKLHSNLQNSNQITTTTTTTIIEPEEFLVSWNDKALGYNNNNNSNSNRNSRESSRSSTSSTERLIDKKIILEDSSFVVGPIKFENIHLGQVRYFF